MFVGSVAMLSIYREELRRLLTWATVVNKNHFRNIYQVIKKERTKQLIQEINRYIDERYTQSI